MSRKKMWRRSLLAICLALAAVGLLYHYVTRPRLNLLLITLDTTRADRLGCYGYEAAQTPTIDALAKEGVLFENAYTIAPLTLPSHATMMTGLFPAEHGLRTNGKGQLSRQVTTLAEILSSRGYRTGAFVGSFVLNAKFGLNRGFQTYDDELSGAEPTRHALYQQRSGKSVVDSAVRWWTEQRSGPVFCWLHFYDPHEPYLAHTEEFGDQFKDRPYDGELAFVDSQVRRITDYLKSRGLEKNTAIVIVGDHGESLGEHEERTHGMTLYQSALHVPLLFSLPQLARGGRRIPQPVSLVNLFPTLLECLGGSVRGRVSGHSLRDALLSGSVPPELCYSATDDPFFEHGWAPLRSLTGDRWKYIRTTKVELYDLVNDPGETRNLAASNAAETQELESLLAAAESRMTLREGGDVQLSAAEKRALASLGYLGGQGPFQAAEEGQFLPDVKDMLPLSNSIDDARKLLEQGRVEDAVSRARELSAQAPDSLPGRVLLGEALAKQGKLDEAGAIFQKIVEDQPGADEAWFHLANVRVAQGRLEEAARLFRESLDISGEKPVVHYNLGLALARLGRSEEALRHYEIALADDPGFVDAHVGLGIIRTSQRRLGDAIRHFETALKYDPAAVEAHSNLAIALAARGDAENAHAHFRRAVEISPEAAETHFNLGMFLATHGRVPEAIAEVEEALRLNPDYPQARLRLEQILEFQSARPP